MRFGTSTFRKKRISQTRACRYQHQLEEQQRSLYTGVTGDHRDHDMDRPEQAEPDERVPERCGHHLLVDDEPERERDDPSEENHFHPRVRIEEPDRGEYQQQRRRPRVPEGVERSALPGNPSVLLVLVDSVGQQGSHSNERPSEGKDEEELEKQRYPAPRAAGSSQLARRSESHNPRAPLPLLGGARLTTAVDPAARKCSRPAHAAQASRPVRPCGRCRERPVPETGARAPRLASCPAPSGPRGGLAESRRCDLGRTSGWKVS